jgi:hypothetical protein
MYQGFGSFRSRRSAVVSLLFHSSPSACCRIAVAFCAWAMLVAGPSTWHLPSRRLQPPRRLP